MWADKSRLFLGDSASNNISSIPTSLWLEDIKKRSNNAPDTSKLLQRISYKTLAIQRYKL